MTYRKIHNIYKTKDKFRNSFSLIKAVTAAMIIIGFMGSASTSMAQGPGDEEIFNSMVDLDAATCRIISTDDSGSVPDVNLAYSYVRPAIVQIHSNGYYGTGTIYSIDRDHITIISNKHVLKDWRYNNNNYVIFYDGAVTDAELIGLSEETDLGIIRVDTSELLYEELIHYRAINYSTNIYDSLATDDLVFTVGSEVIMKNSVKDDDVSIYGSNTGIGNNLYSGILVDPDIYVTNLDRNIIYCYCYAQPGMSGGGIFDGYGHYLGMLTGGTDNDEAVAIRLPDVLDAIEEIVD